MYCFEHSFVPPAEHLQDLVVRAERVELGPAVEVLERIVGAVVRAPPHDALEVSVIVEIFLKEFAARGHVVGEELTLERRPSRRGHLRINSDRDTPPGSRRLPARETERRGGAEQNNCGARGHAHHQSIPRLTVLWLRSPFASPAPRESRVPFAPRTSCIHRDR